MKPVPEYIQKAAVSLLTPFVGQLTPENILKGVDLAVKLSPPSHAGEQPLTITDLAEAAKMSRQRLRRAIRRAGVRPEGLGGPTGREELYNSAAVLAVVQAFRAGRVPQQEAEAKEAQ